MDARINTGGKAFPALCNDHSCNDGGMTLRDWFAGQALAGMCGHPRALSQVSDRDLASDAVLVYRIADAMIAARGGAQ
jgi:hypothetical protein